MQHIALKKLCDNPEFAEKAAHWFSNKWGIPVEAYQESIQACIEQENKIPQWYIVVDSHNAIIGGAGIIENDFHNRVDLTPNLCALFVDEKHRNKKIAKEILNFARKDLGKMGIKTLYLVTDHRAFYEKCGWSFLTMVNDAEGNLERMYFAPTL